MADPLSITASVVAVATAAIQSTKALNDTVKRFKERDKTLQRLQNELEDLSKILETLEEVTSENSILPLLKGPVTRCGQICRDFEKCMQAFHGKSKVGFRDWTKMEFMRGNINDFMDTLDGYKSTITIVLGTITMRTSTLSHKVLEEYSEMIKNTVYSHNVQLQRIDDRVALLVTEKPKDMETSVDLKDEKSVITQCIHICEDASSYIGNLAARQQNNLAPVANSTQSPFEAQLLTRKALDEHRAGFLDIVAHLRKRLETLALDTAPGNDYERARLQDDINTSRQCLEVCNMVSNEVSNQKVYTVGEAIADGDSDQVVVNTLADLFDVRRALSKDSSAQLVASITDESLQQISRDRYGSRFGALPTTSTGEARTVPIHHQPPVVSHTVNNDMLSTRQERKDTRETAVRKDYKKSSPNEVRKRTTDDSGAGSH